MTTIGILGSGNVGSNLARAAIAHGYDVVLSNSQGPDSLAGDVPGEASPAARRPGNGEQRVFLEIIFLGTKIHGSQ